MSPQPHTRELAVTLRQGIGGLTRRLRLTHVESDLSWSETSALAWLDRAGPSTSAELARREQISPQSMGAIVRALEEQGLIARSGDPTDGRRVLLSVTAAGRRLHEDRLDARTDQLADALARWFSPDELDQLRAAAPLLGRLADKL